MSNADDAETLVKRLSGFQFDAAHTFVCNRWSDFQIQDELPSTFTAPQIEENPAANVRTLLLEANMLQPPPIRPKWNKSDALPTKSRFYASIAYAAL